MLPQKRKSSAKQKSTKRLRTAPNSSEDGELSSPSRQHHLRQHRSRGPRGGERSNSNASEDQDEEQSILASEGDDEEQSNPASEDEGEEQSNPVPEAAEETEHTYVRPKIGRPRVRPVYDGPQCQ